MLRVDGGKEIRRALAGPTGEQYKLSPDLGDNCESNSLSMAIRGCVMHLRVSTSSYVSAFMCDGLAGRLLPDSNFRRAYDLVLIGTLHALGVFQSSYRFSLLSEHYPSSSVSYRSNHTPCKLLRLLYHIGR